MRVFSLLAEGSSSNKIEVEYHSRFQIPSFQILGLPAPEIQEARERIIAAFQAASLKFPKKKIVVNLAPSSIKKSGTAHDLGIALKILSETCEREWPADLLCWGELSLDGFVKPGGRMATLIEVLLKKFSWPYPHLLLSSPDTRALKILLEWRIEKSLPIPEKITVQIIDTLADLLQPLRPERLILNLEVKHPTKNVEHLAPLLGLAPRIERLLQLSMIGRHHVLLLGPKGIGKSESIRWLEALLPESKAGQTWERILISESRGQDLDFMAPVRRVHAQVRPTHLLGSFKDRGYLPGELALAHGGLFVADEFMEWPRDSKECLREPLQTRKIFLTRVKGQIECQADFQMVATGNLCPCGGLPSNFRGNIPIKKFACRCRPIEIEHYLSKLSGPIEDRIDLFYLMTEASHPKREVSQIIKLRQEVNCAREFAENHFGALPSDLSVEWLENNLPQSKSIDNLLGDITSLRSRHKILRVARSIQALKQSETLREEFIFEAKLYRFSARS